MLKYRLEAPKPASVQKSIDQHISFTSLLASSSKLTAYFDQSRAMNKTTEQPTDANVRFAPRLTEDSLPVTLPKDADKPLENSAGGEQIKSSSKTSVEDKPVSAGVLDLQLVPQVHRVDLLSTVCPAIVSHSKFGCLECSYESFKSRTSSYSSS